jgi:hypothetical protein
MAWLEAYLPAEDATALEASIEAAAAAMKRTALGDRRPLGQRRADALAQMGWLALGTGRPHCAGTPHDRKWPGGGCDATADRSHVGPIAVDDLPRVGAQPQLVARVELAAAAYSAAAAAGRLPAPGNPDATTG